MTNRGREGSQGSSSPGCALMPAGLVVMVLWAAITGLQLVGREGEE